MASHEATAAFSFTLYKNGNNMHPVRKALRTRSGYFERGASTEGKFWPVNLVWKPTWTNSRLTPQEKFSHGHADPRRRAVVNHHRGVEPLCEKDRLFKVLCDRALAKAVDFNAPPFMVAPFVPPTFVLRPRAGNPADSWSGWPAFRSAFEYFQSQTGCRCLWLCKPANENRGIGIEVLSDLEAIEAFLSGKAARSSMGLNPTWVVQKYMESPLLLHGRKFDIRVWASVADDGTVRMFGPGYIRTSSEPYTLDSNEAFVHLTNYCMQVKNKAPSAAAPPLASAGKAASAGGSSATAGGRTGSFSSHEPGNTLGFDDFAGYLDKFYVPSHLGVWRGAAAQPAAAYVGQPAGGELDCCGIAGGGADNTPEPLSLTGQHLLWDGPSSVWGRMRRIVRSCMEALRQPERCAGAKHGCGEYGFGRKAVSTPQHRFELIGFDFMLDTALRPILIEVNSNPSVSYQTPWHRHMVDDMMQLLFAVHVDPILSPPEAAAGAVQDAVAAAAARQRSYAHTPIPVRPARSGPSSPTHAQCADTTHSTPLRSAASALSPAQRRRAAATTTANAPGRAAKGQRKFTDGTGVEYSPGDSSDSQGDDVDSTVDSDGAGAGGASPPPVALGGLQGTGVSGSPERRRLAKQGPWKAKFRERYPASQWAADAIEARNACIGWQPVCNVFKLKSPYASSGAHTTSAAAQATSAGPGSAHGKSSTPTPGASKVPAAAAARVPRRRSRGRGVSGGRAQRPGGSVAARVRTSPLGVRSKASTAPSSRLLRAVSPITVAPSDAGACAGATSVTAAVAGSLPPVPIVPRLAMALPVSTIAMGSISVQSASTVSGLAASAVSTVPSNTTLPSGSASRRSLSAGEKTTNGKGDKVGTLKLPQLVVGASESSVGPLVSPIRP